MLTFVDRDRSFFDNAGANAVCALHFLGPYAAEPKSPVFELTLLRILNAMFDGDTSAVAEESGISRLANHLVELIDLLLSGEYQLIQRLAKIFQFNMCQDAWRRFVDRVDAIFFCRSLPGVRYFFDLWRRRCALADQIDLFGMPTDMTARRPVHGAHQST